jgi:hypothetical protein
MKNLLCPLLASYKLPSLSANTDLMSYTTSMCTTAGSRCHQTSSQYCASLCSLLLFLTGFQAMGEVFAQKRKWRPLMIANALGPVFLLIVFGALPALAG